MCRVHIRSERKVSATKGRLACLRTIATMYPVGSAISSLENSHLKRRRSSPAVQKQDNQELVFSKRIRLAQGPSSEFDLSMRSLHYLRHVDPHHSGHPGTRNPNPTSNPRRNRKRDLIPKEGRMPCAIDRELSPADHSACIRFRAPQLAAQTARSGR